MNSAPEVTIYHNPRCSKSRAACALLAANNIQATVIDYLENPLSTDELRELLQKLGLTAEELVRRGEEVFNMRYAGKILSDDEWLDALAECPVLIERPIIVWGDQAVIGRPVAKINEFLAIG